MIFIFNVYHVDKIFDASFGMTAEPQRRSRRRHRHRRRRIVVGSLGVMKPSDGHPIEAHVSLNAAPVIMIVVVVTSEAPMMMMASEHFTYFDQNHFFELSRL